MFKHYVIDDFYSNPEEILDLEGRIDYKDSTQKLYPGIRTDNLYHIDRNLFDLFCKKILSLYYDLSKTHIRCQVATSFQLIERYSDNKFSPFNSGWIHRDFHVPDFQMAGVVYLNKISENNTGTNLYKLREGCEYPSRDRNTYKKLLFNGFPVDEQEYAIEMDKRSRLFDLEKEIENKYNRMICYDSYQYHGVPSFYRENGSRLTQVFFIKNIHEITKEEVSIQIPDIFNDNDYCFFAC